MKYSNMYVGWMSHLAKVIVQHLAPLPYQREASSCKMLLTSHAVIHESAVSVKRAWAYVQCRAAGLETAHQTVCQCRDSMFQPVVSWVVE